MCSCLKAKEEIRNLAMTKFMQDRDLSEIEKEILWGEGCFSLEFVLKHPNLFKESDCAHCLFTELLKETKCNT